MNRAARLQILILLVVTLSGLTALFPRVGYASLDDLIVLDLVPDSCDGLITLDTISNREWLDVAKSAYVPWGVSYNDLTGPGHDCNPTCTTGEFAGWTLASVDDVLSFFENAGLSETMDYGTARGFINLVGALYANVFIRLVQTGGFTGDLASPSEVHSFGVSAFCSRPPLLTCTGRYSQGEYSIDGRGSAWLYRISSSPPPEVDFCAYPTNGPAPLTVRFTDRSYQATSWLWDFGDGSTSTEQYPSHTYNTSGNYTVSLTVTDASSSSHTKIKEAYIEVNYVDPIADFWANPTTGLPPLRVHFYNDSTGSFTEWSWNFGDGSTSTEQNPYHTYTDPGAYTVSLTVTGPEGSDTKTVTDYITVVTPDFSDAAASEVEANYESDLSVYYWNIPSYSSQQSYVQDAYDYAAEAYLRANLALNENTTFWGIYAVQYIEGELSIRAEALTYIDLAVQYDAAGDSDIAEYYGTYGFSVNALADLYNGSAIWCCSMEGSIEATGQQGTFAGSPSFSSAASNGWLANMYFATSLAYAILILDDPSYYPFVQLYASTAYDYAEAAYNDASAALAAAGEDSTFWGSYAVQYAASDLDYRSESLSYIDLAVEAYQAGDLETAKDYLSEGYLKGCYADQYNGPLIWCASMESAGGAK